MEVYGLTGGIGSGKSTVAAMLEDYGIPVVSADELSRMVVAPGSDGLGDVVAAFGAGVLDDRGELDRKKMSQIVIERSDGRRQLESILHPRIRERYEQVLDALEKAGHPVMVYEVPLLFEKKLDQQDEMRAVILVSATADTRIARLKARDSLTTDDVIARMRAQMPEEEKRSRADYILHNDGDLDDLRIEVEHLLASFLRIPSQTERAAPVEEIEELEIDEAEIDTLSPDDIVEEATPAPTAVPSPRPHAPTATTATAAVPSPRPHAPTATATSAPTAVPSPRPHAPTATTATATTAAPAAPAPAAPAPAAPTPAAPAAPAPPAVAPPPAAGPPSSPPPAAAPTPPATTPPASGGGETDKLLEVELHPTGPQPTVPKSNTSGSAWIPAGPATTAQEPAQPQAPPAQAEQPATAQAPAPPRPHAQTAPQLEVPEDDSDEESGS